MKSKYPVRIACNIFFFFALMSVAMAQDKIGEYKIFKPDGSGPHPAIVLLCGASGFTPNFAPNYFIQYSQRLNEMGFIVIWEDFLERYNVQHAVFGSLSQIDVAHDAVNAASWLRSQPYIDPNRISLIGWSWGGGAALFALSKFSPDELIFSRVIAYYPYCNAAITPWSHQIPVLVMVGESDDIAPYSAYKDSLDKSSEKENIRFITYPGALHAFDLSDIKQVMKFPWGSQGYNPEAAAASWVEVKKFLQNPNK